MSFTEKLPKAWKGRTMMISGVWSRGSTKDRFSISSLFPVLAMMIALLLMGMLEALAPSIISNTLPATYAAQVLAPAFSALVLGIMIMAILIVLRQDELTATVIVAIHLYIDWYLGLDFVAQIITLVLLLIFFLARSPQSPWAEPRALWLWILFAVLTIIPAIQGIALVDTLNYYFNIIFGSLMIFWLGILIARNAASVRRFLQMLAGFGTLIAIHSIIQAVTGKLLFATSRFDVYLGLSPYGLPGTSVSRAGSFLINPDSSGGFFAMMFFIPLALFLESTSLVGKVLYLAEMFLMLIALLFSYSTGGWLAFAAGIVAFIIFVGHVRYRTQLALFIVIVTIVLLVFFPGQINLQIQHATAPNEAPLRVAAWQTGIQVIRAFPLFGIGVGRYVYLERAEPYRVPSQYVPLYHPHNSYIEIGALAGLPVLFVFIALLAFAFWLALRNWMLSDAPTRTLIGGGIATVIALSANSMVVNGWTLIPLAAIGWLVLGVISSPLLEKYLNREVMKEKKTSNR